MSLLLGLSLFVPAHAAEPCITKRPGKPLGSLKGPTIATASISPDGTLLALGIEDKDRSHVSAFELPSGKLLWTHRPGSSPVSMDLSPDGGKLAVAYQQTGYESDSCLFVELLNPTNGAPSGALEFPTRRGAQSVAFSHDGRLLATAVSWSLNIWNTGGGIQFATLDMPSALGKSVDYPFSLSFSPDDSLLAVTDPEASSILVWKMADSKIIRKFRISAKPNVDGDALFSPDGKFIAVSSPGPVKVFSLAVAPRGSSSQICEIPKPPSGKIAPVAFTSDHAEVWLNASAGLEKWSCAASKPPQRLIEGKTPFDRVLPRKDGSFIGISKIDHGKITLANAQSGKLIAIVSLPSPAK